MFLVLSELRCPCQRDFNISRENVQRKQANKTRQDNTRQHKAKTRGAKEGRRQTHAFNILSILGLTLFLSPFLLLRSVPTLSVATQQGCEKILDFSSRLSGLNFVFVNSRPLPSPDFLFPLPSCRNRRRHHGLPKSKDTGRGKIEKWKTERQLGEALLSLIRLRSPFLLSMKLKRSEKNFYQVDSPTKVSRSKQSWL